MAGNTASGGVTCLIEGALAVLQESNPWEKRRITEHVVALWNTGDLPVSNGTQYAVPDRPQRSDEVKLVAPRDMPKLGKGGTLASRQAILHSLSHIESWAVDLSWDIIARFGQDPSYALPRQFFDDFVRVAEDECRHFTLLAARLEATGSRYGALPAHDGLWESASATSHSLAARLAVEHCVHEARGLDVLPSTIRKFRDNGDAESAKLLSEVVYPEEISHCAAGVRWLQHLFDLAHSRGAAAPSAVAPGPGCGSCSALTDGGEASSGAVLEPDAMSLTHKGGAHGTDESASADESSGVRGVQGEDGAPGRGHTYGGQPEWVLEARQHESVTHWFHALIRAHFKGNTKPPFNTEARAAAGFTAEWYLPLAQPCAQ